MPDENGQSASACSQVAFLFALLLRLKMWKFLFWVLIVPVLFLNFLLLRGLESRNPDNAAGTNIKGMSAGLASASVTLVSSSATSEIRSMQEIMQNRRAKSRSWLSQCKTTPECQASFIESLLSRSSNGPRAFMKFEKQISQFECLDGSRADLLCSYLYHVMSQSMDRNGSTGASVFQDLQFLKLFDKFETDTVKRERARANISSPDSLCTRSALNGGAFFDYFPNYLMLHMVLVAGIMNLYFTVSTLSSVYGLKENGFMQLIFNSGLSVGAYWFVVWLITVIEALLIAALVVVSYSAQCPSFFTASGLLKAFAILVGLYLFMASLGLFFTTIIGSYFITLLLMIFLNVLLATIALMSRTHVASSKGKVSESGKLEFILLMLLFPPGHVVEYMLEVMLPLTPVYQRLTGYSEYYTLTAILMPAVPAVLMILTIYLDFILKSGNGLCLPLAFPMNPNFWNPHRQKLIEMVDSQPKRPNVEPTTGVPAVIATDIFMTYPGACCETRPTVLNGVTCTVYQGQITALIGHNGAGKTTLIRVLMGEEIPTSGLAVINGHRVTDPYQRLALRGRVSICKQVDVLSNCLTVMESMKLALLAKGFSVDSQVNKALDMLKRLGLGGKENVMARDLSGGQMRKVCSIIALLGNPELVILDEPTSGLDPVSRRNLWQVLQDHKAGRSIILCTQFMDEADILADRKMFLSAGKLVCAGSSIFLKHVFGCCVTINVSLKSERDAKQVLKMMKKVKLVSQIKTELQCQIAADKVKSLADAIQKLEDHPEMIKAFGVSQAQLDDIFMRLKYIDMDNIEGSFRSKKLRKLGKLKSADATLVPVDYSKLYSPDSSKSVSASVIAQFCSLLTMNFSRQRKTKLKFCFSIIFPVILIITIVIMVDSERADAIGKNKEDAGGKSKPLVRVLVSDFHSMGRYGICLFDKDPKADDKTAQDQITTACKKMFDIKDEEANHVRILSKPSDIMIDTFLKQQDTLKAIREICRISYCFIVFASSWDTSLSNAKRTVQIAQYTNPSDIVVPNEAAMSIGHMLSVYMRFAQHFSALPRPLRANLTLKRTYTIGTFDAFSFKTCYDVLAFITAFSIVPITYLSDPIEDKDCGVRQHLASMGMSSLAYWLTTFLMHWLHFALYFVLSVCACMVWERYQSIYFLVNVCLPVLLLATTSSQLSVYVVSAVLKKSNAIVMVTYLFFGLFLGVAAVAMQDMRTAVLVLACAVPQFTPAVFILMSVKIMAYSLQFFDLTDPDLIPNLAGTQTSNTVILGTLIAMPVHIVILIGLLILIENPGALQRACAKSAADSSEGGKSVKDVGVKLEASRVSQSVRNQSNMLEVRDLQKVYPNGVRAVRGTTFGVITGEILGLLGPNGAGKTTSMSIIVGEEEPSGGSSEVNFGGSWMSGIDGAKCGAIGYCPQHNPLFNSISVFEHLCFYARIRGLPAELAKVQVAGLIDGLGLKPHQEKAAEQLSGGNKRRLCLAIALLGNPALVVIDEASTGVDPENKRFIWSAIRGMASKFRSVMITTHSMEEVEALCSRVGIMNKGVMIGFGTVQQLRSRYGEAYTLDILMKAKKPRKLDIKKKKLAKGIAKHFKNVILVEDLMRCMQFFIPKTSVDRFSGAMRLVISLRKKLGIRTLHEAETKSSTVQTVEK